MLKGVWWFDGNGLDINDSRERKIFQIYSCTGKIRIESNDELVKYEITEVSKEGVVQPFICGNEIPQTARCSNGQNMTSELVNIMSEMNDSSMSNGVIDINPSKRIIGGTINKTNKFPWVVQFIYTNQNRESFVCGAAIYSSTALITGKSSHNPAVYQFDFYDWDRS